MAFSRQVSYSVPLFGTIGTNGLLAVFKSCVRQFKTKTTFINVNNLPVYNGHCQTPIMLYYDGITICYGRGKPNSAQNLTVR